MAKKHEPKPPGQWTTLEELLLAYAVKRFGTESWEAIAKELQSRVAMQRNYVSSVITPQNCRDKFLRLRRRFLPLDSVAAEEETAKTAAAEEEEEACLVSMLDELRRIRIEELRREVKRHDDSIVFLESRIKRLEDDRKQSVAEETDLRGQASKREEMKESPAIIAGESSATAAEALPADESDNRSFNESNSIGQKAELAMASRDTKNDAVKGRIPPSAKREPTEETGTISVQKRTEPDRNRDSSSRFKNADNDDGDRRGGTTEAEAAAEVGQATKGTRAIRLAESNELRDSVSESKKEAGSSKQSSDVQSSASRSRMKRRRKLARGGGEMSSGEEEPEADEVSLATQQKRVAAVKPPEPLVDLLRRIRSHRLGSAFERRLRIQESERYRNLIRQRMDLRIIQSRLERGAYSDCFTKFYRDLLLLFNNAIVFHRKTSSEYRAAVELRALVSKAMKARLRNRPPAMSIAPPSKSKPFKQPPQSVASLKSKSSKPVIGACGKRSSLKPTTGKTNSGRDMGGKNKQDVIVKESKDVGRSGGSTNITRKFRRERSGNTNNRNNNIGGSAKNSRPTTVTKKESDNVGETQKHEYGNNELSSHDTPVSKPMAKSINAKNVKKKQGVVSFLRRMKQSVSSDSDNDRDADANRDNSRSEGEEEQEEEEEEEEEDEKAKIKGKRKEGVATRSISSSLAAGKRKKVEKEKKGKKSTGRPVRRAAAAVTATAAVGGTAGKRGRENNGEGRGGGARAKKRVRR